MMKYHFVGCFCIYGTFFVFLIKKVTYVDAESAKRACNEPNPVIDGRRANCNIASLGQPRSSPSRGSIF